MSRHAVQKTVAAGVTLIAVLGVSLTAPAFSKSFHTLAILPPITTEHAYRNLSGLAVDPQGRLYGASTEGGAFSYGYIYRLTPGATKSDPWSFETLHNFNVTDGASPVGDLTLGPAGEVYGTTAGGGAYSGGTAFRLDNEVGWPLTILHAFGAKHDPGYDPRGSLIFGPNGLLYGTTFASLRNPSNAAGDLFALSPLGDSVSYSVIHNFAITPGPEGGFEPNGNLVAAPDGNIYGTTMSGGLTSQSTGVFFKLSQGARGEWRYSNLHDFIFLSGDYFPMSPVRASDGTFYGCSENFTDRQHASGGSVYALTPPRPGAPGWTESTVTVLPPYPSGNTFEVLCEGVAVDPAAGLIVTDMILNATSAYGKVLRLLPPVAPRTPWTTSTLHVFEPDGLQPFYPISSLLRKGGLYYGVTVPNVPVDGGTVYDVRP